MNSLIFRTLLNLRVGEKDQGQFHQTRNLKAEQAHLLLQPERALQENGQKHDDSSNSLMSPIFEKRGKDSTFKRNDGGQCRQTSSPPQLPIPGGRTTTRTSEPSCQTGRSEGSHSNMTGNLPGLGGPAGITWQPLSRPAANTS